MRILFISGLYAPYVKGGAEVVAVSLAQGLQKRGHEVCVLTTGSEPGMEAANIDGIEVMRFGIKNSYWPYQYDKPSAFKRISWHLRDSYNLAAANDILSTVKSYAPDIVVCHNLAGFSVSVWRALSEIGIPVVQILHDYYTLCPRSTLFRKESCCEQRCTDCKAFRLGHAYASKSLAGVIAVSNAVMDIHHNYGMFDGVPFQKVIYNAQAIDVSKEPNPIHEVFTIGYIGRLSIEKGIGILIASFKQLAVSQPSVKLLVAGIGEPEFVQSLIESAEGFNVEFLGKVNPSEFYQKIDLCVVPSIWQEPLGLVSIEALAHGIPVIGANRGGIPEVVKHRLNGLIFDPDMPDGLLSAMNEIINSKELRARISSIAKSSVNDFINEARMIDEHELFYHQVMAIS